MHEPLRKLRPCTGRFLGGLLALACGGGQSFDDGSDALDAKSDHANDAPGDANVGDSEAEGLDDGQVRAPALCDECYVVNSAITGNTDGELFLASYFGISDSSDQVLRHYSGGQWRELDRWGDAFGIVRELWATDGAVYGTTGEQLWRYDLEDGTRVNLEPAAVSVWGYSATSVFALTRESVHWWDGEQWLGHPSPLGGEVPLGVSGATDVDGRRGPLPAFVISELGSVSAFAEDSWGAPSEPLGVALNDFAVSGSVVYAVAGEDQSSPPPGPGLIAKFEDSEWSVVQDAERDALLAVAATTSGVAYAVGATREESNEARAVVWKLESGAWTRHQLELEAFLWDAWCADSGPCYAAGTDNTLVSLEDLD